MSHARNRKLMRRSAIAAAGLIATAALAAGAGAVAHAEEVGPPFNGDDCCGGDKQRQQTVPTED